ncbi:MAG: hypothetical protein R3174_14425, partial [Gammaproteobacteria bacterium]|nr:hypothetical protein [Gammaproteobacteria bacterium]
LPGDDLAWGIYQRCRGLLADAGYRQYEVSAYARPGGRCRHNLNYWRFGDYLGIGAGAHGKLTPAGGGLPVRSLKHRHPRAYLEGAESGRFDLMRRTCEAKSLPLEFMMNALRLMDGVELTRFTETTTLPLEVILPQLELCRERGLLEESPDRLQPTPQGFRFLNELLLLFAGADTEAKTAVSGATVAVAPYAATGGAVT